MGQVIKLGAQGKKELAVAFKVTMAYVGQVLSGQKKVSIRPRACFSPSYNKVKSQTKHVWLLTLL